MFPFLRIKFSIFILLVLSSCMVTREILFQNSGINDHKIFPSRTLDPSTEPFQFFRATAGSLNMDSITVTHDKKHQPLKRLIENSKTVGFLIIRNDSILFENYYHKYTDSSFVNSFSTTKSFTSALVGIAVQEGKIASVEDTMTKYLTELRGKGLGGITIRHLLQMTSGISSGETYLNPFSMVAKMYYGTNQKKLVSRLTLEQRPGATFQYRSINTLLLGMIVERVMEKPLTELLQERIWTPLGMEHAASWSLDHKNGFEKPFACFNATARDFAKFGRLYLNKGTWNGKRILDEDWVKKSSTVDARDGAAWYYQYQWWLASKNGGDFYAAGYLGQFIYVNPAKNVIIVRLGKNEGGIYWPGAFKEIASQL